MTNLNNINDNDYIIIPNPIYDVVFKYLMSDVESATIILSTLINEKIIKLNLEPLTHSQKETQVSDPKTQKDVRLFHLDFTATVELPDGTEELIMIELQKASEPGDIFRFKRYISQNFQRKQEKEILNPKTQSIEKIDTPIRLIPIFILNFRIENEINDLLIKTNHLKTGVFKNKQLQNHNEFIDNLTYDIWVIQLPNLNNITEEEYKNDEYLSKLYALLKLFDQKSKIKNNEHRLRVIRKFFPGFLERVIKRLQSAAIENPNLEEQMFAEDEYLQALIKRDNTIEFMEQQIEKDKQQIETKDKQIEKDKQQIETKDKQIEKDKNIILDLAKTLKENGVSIEMIQQKTNLTKQQIEKL